jgi:hypothetical protein
MPNAQLEAACARVSKPLVQLGCTTKRHQKHHAPAQQPIETTAAAPAPYTRPLKDCPMPTSRHGGHAAVTWQTLQQLLQLSNERLTTKPATSKLT